MADIPPDVQAILDELSGKQSTATSVPADVQDILTRYSPNVTTGTEAYTSPTNSTPHVANRNMPVLDAMGQAYYGATPFLPESFTDPIKKNLPFYLGYPLDAISHAPNILASLYRGAQQVGVNAGLPNDIVSLGDSVAGSPNMLASGPRGAASYLVNRATGGRLGDIAPTVPAPTNQPAFAKSEPMTMNGGYHVDTVLPVSEPDIIAPGAAKPAESTVGAAQTSAENIVPNTFEQEKAYARKKLEETDYDRRNGGAVSSVPIDIPDLQRTLGELNLNHAGPELAFRNRFKEDFTPVDTANHAAIKTYLESHTPDDIAIGNMNVAREAQRVQDIAPMEKTPQPVNPQSVSTAIDDYLKQGGTDRPFVRNALNAVKQTLYDGDGNLITDPNRLYNGAYKNISDMLERGKLNPASDEATASNFLTNLHKQLGDSISETNPSFQTYRDNYHAASKEIDAAEVMNKVLQRVITPEGKTQLKPLDTQLTNIFNGRYGPGVNPVKSLTEPQIGALYQVRDYLAGLKQRDEYGRVVGSNTVLNSLLNDKYTPPTTGPIRNLLGQTMEGAVGHFLGSQVPVAGNMLARGYFAAKEQGRIKQFAKDAADFEAKQKGLQQQRLQEIINPKVEGSGPDFSEAPAPRAAGAQATPPEQISQYTPTTDLAAYHEATRPNALADQPGIRAFHGSGADFDRFSNDYIGTGEGAQVYGVGHYAAQQEGVARYYRDAMSKEGLGVNGKPIADAMMEATKGAKPGDAVLEAWIMARNRAEHAYNNYGEQVFGQAAKDMIKSEADDRAMSAQRWRNLAEGKATNGYEASLVGKKTGKPGENEAMLGMAASQDEMAQELYKLAAHDYGLVQPGKMYELNINANPEHFLDWDKPLNQQSDHVKNAIANSPLGGYEDTNLPGSQIAPMTVAGAKAMSTYGIKGIKYLDQNSRNDGGWHITPPSQTMTGKWMVKSNDYNSKGMHFDTEAEAQRVLADKIGDETRNFVVFDPETIKIIRKYGIAALMGGAAGAALSGKAQANPLSSPAQ